MGQCARHIPPGTGKVFVVSTEDVWRHQGAAMSLALLRRDDLEKLRAGAPHSVMEVTPDAVQGSLDYQVPEPGDYVVVVDNMARAATSVHVRIWLDFARRGPTVTQLSPRRQLTVMFVDLVDSTALAARLDPEEMAEVLRTQARGDEKITRVAADITTRLPDQRFTDAALRQRVDSLLQRIREALSPVAVNHSAALWSSLPIEAKAAEKASRISPTPLSQDSAGAIGSASCRGPHSAKAARTFHSTM